VLEDNYKFFPAVFLESIQDDLTTKSTKVEKVDVAGNRSTWAGFDFRVFFKGCNPILSQTGMLLKQ